MALRGLLLCGGASTRFGRDKLLEKFGSDPEFLVAHSARSLVGGIGRVLAVARPGARALREVLEAQGCEVMESDRALDGMGASLAAGVSAAADASGWVVALGDMPFVREETVRLIRAALEAGAMIAAPIDRQSGRRGHPVGFSAALREELLALRGDEGARSVIARHRESIVLVAVDDAGIFRDIDRPEDLAPP